LESLSAEAGDGKALSGPGDRVVARESLEEGSVQSKVLFVDSREDQLLRGLAFVPQGRAVLGRDAILVGSLQLRNVLPSINEVAVISKTSRITIGEDKLIVVVVHTRLIEELEEDGEDGDGMAGGTDPEIIISNGGVGNVRLVIRRVEVLSVPAAGKVDLSTDLAALGGRETMGLARGTIDAHHGNCGVREIIIASRGSPSIGITRNHPKALRRSKRNVVLGAALQAVSVIARSSLIIYCTA